MTTSEEIVASIEEYEFSYTCEDDLQKAIASVLSDCSIPYQREYRLNEKDRLDFKVGTIAIEVKIKGGLTEVARQVGRYLQSSEVTSVILVTTRSAHRNLPPSLNGKPIYVSYLPPL